VNISLTILLFFLSANAIIIILTNKEYPSDIEKRTIRSAEHCVAKILVSTNPGLLTVSQRMGVIKPLIRLIRDHDSTDLQRFEALLSLTNVASHGHEVRERIIAEKGVSTLSYAMFSDHSMVRTAATESICNLVSCPEVIHHLSDPERMKIWVAFASDFNENYECSRAAAGCLAEASCDPGVADSIIQTKRFEEMVRSLLECGRLELMHRVLVLLLNLLSHGGMCRERVLASGSVAFCDAYAASFHDKSTPEQGLGESLGINELDQRLLPVTVNLAKEIVRSG